MTKPVPTVVAEYLTSVPGERGDSLRAVFDTVNEAMPSGYVLGDYRGAPSWTIPLATYPVTYNKQPLDYVALIAQKNYNSLYLMGLYLVPADAAEFERAWLATGRRLNMGKSCLRFKTLADLDLDLIAGTISSMPVPRLVDTYEHAKQLK